MTVRPTTFAVLDGSASGTRLAHPGASAGMPSRRQAPTAARGLARERCCRPRLQLFTLSFLMLFVELALIRWSGALVIYLSYFSNFVLLGSFLGIGIGFLRARSRVNLFPCAPVALALLILSSGCSRSRSTGPGTQLIFFGYGTFHASGPPTWVTLPVVFLAVAAVMATIGEGVARTFIRFRPLDAYRLDIAGSITGIAAFSLLSFLDAKPVVWALIVALVLLLLYGRRTGPAPGHRGPRPRAAALVGIPVVHRHLVALLPHLGDAKSGGDQYAISVNGIPHQNIIPARKLPKVYSLPYLDAPRNPLNNVLIVGAGTGDDVANALLRGGQAHRRGGDRSPAVPAGQEAEPGPPLPGPPGHRAYQRRPGLPRADAHEVRHDPVRPARLADPGGRAVLAAAGELPVHAPGRAGGEGPPEPGRRDVRHVQLLPDALAPRPAGEHPGDRLRARPVRRITRPPALDALRHHQPVRHALHHRLARARPTSLPPATDDHPFVYLRRQLDPLALPGDARPDPAGVDPAGPPRLRAVPEDGRLCRPVLHGGGVHAARDEEHRPVRAAVRHHLVRQRAGDGGCPGRGVRRGGGISARGVRRPALLYPACSPR